MARDRRGIPGGRRRFPSADGLHPGHRRGGGQGVPDGDRAGVPAIPGDAGGRRLRPWPDVPVFRSGHRAAAGLGKAGRRAQGAAARDGPPALECGPASELPGADGCRVPGSGGAGKRAGLQPAGPAVSGRRPGGLREAGSQAAERPGVALPEDEPASLRTGARAPCQVSEHAFPCGARRESGPRRLAGRAPDRIGWRCSKGKTKDAAAS